MKTLRHKEVDVEQKGVDNVNDKMIRKQKQQKKIEKILMPIFKRERSPYTYTYMLFISMPFLCKFFG